MGLLLSVLVVCVGVLEALDCYYHFRAGLLPPARAAHSAPTSGWRHHLTNLNERWRRKPSGALTCGVRGGGGGESVSSAPRRIPRDVPDQSLNGGCCSNGAAALSDFDDDSYKSQLNGHQIAPNQHPLEVLVNDGDRGLIAISQVNDLIPLLPDPYAVDAPRRLSDAFPEIENISRPENLHFLKTEVDLPRRLSDIAAEVPLQLAANHGDDQPRRLSDEFRDKLSHLKPLKLDGGNLEDVSASLSDMNHGQNLVLSRDEESPPSRRDSLQASVPPSPSRTSHFDISWPTFNVSHSAHKQPISRIEEIMSIDVEDYDDEACSDGLFSKVNIQKPIAELPMATALPDSSESDMSCEQKEMHGQLKLMKANISHVTASAPCDDANNQGTSFEIDCGTITAGQQEILNSMKCFEDKRGNDINLHQGTTSAREIACNCSKTDTSAKIQGLQLILQQHVNDTDPSCPASKEYLNLVHFLSLLKVQEENPGDDLLEPYFKNQRKEEFRVTGAERDYKKSHDNFKEYNELVVFLESLRKDASQYQEWSLSPNCKENIITDGGVPSKSIDSSHLLTEPLRPLLPDVKLVNISTEPQRLQKPARCQSFEEASPDLSETVTKTTLEYSLKEFEEKTVPSGQQNLISISAVELENEEEKNILTTKIGSETITTNPAKDQTCNSKIPPACSQEAPASISDTPFSGDSSHNEGSVPLSGKTIDAQTQSRSKSPTKRPEAFWLIFSGEYTKAMSKDWHSGHFCCWQCDESLTGQRYVLRDDHPYCIKCYESVFANTCEECSKIIGIDSKDLSYKEKHWHEACFLCSKCRVSLVDKQFGSKADHIYCGNCYDAQFASRCDGCGEIFRAGTKKMEYKTRQWHEKCFCCVVCKTAIGTKSFIPREQEIYCATCYEEKFATRCVKCNKIITSGGVTYKNEPWHRECFTCTNCNTSLAGQRFTSRDEKPYCADCFGELFAKRCTACTKPITGIGGTRFISFEDRHWHNDCFICASCKTSLVGRGFITDADDIICPECAKQKLM